MSSYDDYAKHYDLSVKYTEDISFYVKEGKKAKGPVLELGCGTGRIYFELLKNGVDAYGIDLSRLMLSNLRKKAKRMGVEPKVYFKDMRTFKFNRKFDLIIIPFRAFLHMETREDQIKCLKNARKHLKKGGRLILNFFDPDLKRVAKEKHRWKSRKWVDGGDKFLLEEFTTFDLVNQKITTNRTIKKNGKVFDKHNLSLCYIFPREFMNMLELCGFRKWKLYGGFDYKPYKKHGSELVWIAYK